MRRQTRRLPGFSMLVVQLSSPGMVNTPGSSYPGLSICPAAF